MGLFNELLSSRWNNLASRFLPVDEQQGVTTVSPDLQLILNIQQDADLRYLLAERLAGGWTTAAAAAGQQSFAALRNPSGSGVLAVLESLTLPTAGLQFDFGIADAAGAPTSPAPQLRDGRFGVARVPSCVITQGTGLAIATSGGLTVVPAATEGYQRMAWVIPPGLAFYVRCGTVNTAFSASFLWRERGYQPGELV